MVVEHDRIVVFQYTEMTDGFDGTKDTAYRFAARLLEQL